MFIARCGKNLVIGLNAAVFVGKTERIAPRQGKAPVNIRRAEYCSKA